MGSTVCLEMLSFTLIWRRYTPGSRLAAARVFVSVIWSLMLPIVSVDSTVWIIGLLVTVLTTLYSTVADGRCVCPFREIPRNG